MADQTYYCTNCKKLLVCKYTQLILAHDAAIKKFNDDNSAIPVRITITSTNYNCRHKENLV